jgi:pseudouridine synthase
LLLTNDGGLVHHVTNPAPKKESKATKSKKGPSQSSGHLKTLTKTYEALIMGYHENYCESFEQMRLQGVDIGKKYGGMTKPVDHLAVLGHPTPKSTLVRITISEGRNRQVRRMFHSIGSGVMKLKRTKIGTKLTLEGLEEGQWRIMADEEVEDTLHWKVRRLDESKTRRNTGIDSGGQAKTKAKYPGAHSAATHGKSRPRRKRP